MILLADEDLHRKIVERLEEAGHEVTHIADLAPSITDHEVLALAVERNALLIPMTSTSASWSTAGERAMQASSS